MKQYTVLVVMLVLTVSCTAAILTPRPTKPATPTRPPTGTPTATWTLNSGSDIETFTSTVAFRQGQGQIYYVATNGDDSNPGTEAQPFRTINKGTSVLQAGDTLYVRAGTYHEKVVISNSGTANNPITISAYPGETPVIDGQNNIPGDWSHLLRLGGSYIVVNGLEVKNSASVGVAITGSHNEVHNLNVHHSWYNGILIVENAYDNLVEGCEIWWNVRQNEDGTMGESGWAIGLANRYSDYTILRNNVVYNNWGEGISSVETEHTTIEDNVVYDNYAVNIYIMNAVYTLVQRNLVYHTGDNRWYMAPGIAFCDEAYLGHARLRYTTVINNMILGGNRTFYFWQDHPDSGLKHSLIAYNTFVNSHSGANFEIEPGNHENSRIENNIFLQEDSLPIADVDNDPDLHFSHNLWSKTPPSHVSSSDDVIGDPQLAKSGSTGPGLLTPEWFKILASSPALERGKIIAEVTEDFFRNPRGSAPDIGAHESPFSTRVTDLRVVAAIGDTSSLNITLRWTAPVAAVTYTLRSSNTLLTAINWSDAPIVTVPFTASAPGSSEWLTTPVDYTSDTLYLALKSQDSEGDWSELSNNAFWSHWDIYLPLVMKSQARSELGSLPITAIEGHHPKS